MCVTNTTHRRVQAMTLTPTQVGGCPSALSQRLLGTYTLPQNALATPRQDLECFMQPLAEKPRVKRRRKPQKPGMTAKMNERHFVTHNYHDHALDVDENDSYSADQSEEHRRRGGVAIAFPEKLHQILLQVERDGYSHVISWQPHGRCFVVHQPKEFVDHVMPRYFRQTKLTSFQRQLNLYGFNRLTRGADAGGYYHELFLRGKEFLCKQMIRIKVKGTKFKAASSPDQEPDLYTMPPVVYVTPSHSSDEEASFDSSACTADASLMQPLAVQQPLPVQSFCFSPQATMSAIEAYSPVVNSSYNVLAAPTAADSILDQAVDELFMGEKLDDDNLADFVNEWDPTNSFGASFGSVLNDDIQLGYMLDRLLED